MGLTSHSRDARCGGAGCAGRDAQRNTRECPSPHVQVDQLREAAQSLAQSRHALVAQSVVAAQRQGCSAPSDPNHFAILLKVFPKI